MRALSRLGCLGEGPSAEKKAKHAAFGPFGQIGNLDRTANHASPFVKGVDRVLQIPLDWHAQINGKRVCLPLGKNGNGGPVIAKDGLAAREHIAHSAIATIDDE